MVVAIYAAAIAGAAYVPIDPELPAARVRAMLDECASPPLLLLRRLRPAVPAGYAGELMEIDDGGPLCPSAGVASTSGCSADSSFTDHHIGPRLPADAASTLGGTASLDADGLLYVMFTSGTTGRPKGVMVSHASLCHRVRWLQDTFPLTAHDSLMLKAPYGFGVSEWEIFWPLLTGARLVVTRPDGHRDAAYLQQTIRSNHVSVLFFVPSMLSLFIDVMQLENKPPLPSVQRVFCAGEPLRPSLCQRFHASGRLPHATLHNLYGPTEADMTIWTCPPPASAALAALALVPAGRPICKRSQVFVMSEAMQPLPAGVEGEIAFGGIGVAAGYIGQEELTARAFRPNPHGVGRLYMTGDMGRWLADGNLEFLGRRDRQVKLRGVRLELGDVEEAVCRCDGVLAAVVTTYGEGDSRRLVAYATPHSLDANSVLERLRQLLPPVMVPAAVVILERMPLSTNGKVDIGALPPPATMPNGVGADHSVLPPRAAPRTATEAAVAQCWAQVLGIEDASRLRTDLSFEAAGGNSLLAGRVTTALRLRLDLQLPSTVIYQYNTIEKLAAFCEHFAAAGRNGAVGEKRHPTWKSSPRAYGGASSRSCRALVVQFIGILLAPIINDVVPLIEYALLLYLYSILPCHVALLLSPLVTVMLGGLVVVFAVGSKWLLLGRVAPGRYPLWGWFYLRWWLVNNLVGPALEDVEKACGDTPLLPLVYRMLGARVGADCSLDGGVSCPADADLLDIGDQVRLARASTVCTFSISNGWLTLSRVKLGDGVDVGVGAYVSSCDLPDGSRVGALSGTYPSAAGVVSEGNFAPLSSSARRDRRAQMALRCGVGLPLLLLLQALSALPTVLLLKWLYVAAGGAESTRSVYLIAAVSPWMITFVTSEVYFWLVVAIKWLVLGRSRPGRWRRTHFARFRLWLLERLSESEEFEGATQPWISTELLSLRFRLMGARVGRRVQIDHFSAVEHELVHIGHNVLFGSGVVIECGRDDDLERKLVAIDDEANVLDHTVVLSGARLGRGALLGSMSLLGEDAMLPPLSVSTGNVGGGAALLSVRKPQPPAAGALGRRNAAAAAVLERMEYIARQRSESTAFWLGFNVAAVLIVLVLHPLPLLANVSALAAAYVAWGALGVQLGVSSSTAAAVVVACFPLVNLAATIAELLLVLASKWLVVGRYREGSYPFFGVYHLQWTAMMLLMEGIEPVLSVLHGSYYASVVYRLFGATIGDNVCLLTSPLEFDLLRVGDRAVMGLDCDVTCHTVERMVIKLAPVTIGTNASMHNASMVMPGATLGDGATLLPLSQVLKGETVGENEVWAGLPACRIEGNAREANWWAVRVDMTEKDRSSRASGWSSYS